MVSRCSIDGAGLPGDVRVPGGSRGRPGERGQVVPLLAVALVLFGVVALGLVRVAATVTHRSAAQAAADATALAGAVDGPDAARDVAAANDARVVTYVDEGSEVQVTVERHGLRATARARWDPTGGTPMTSADDKASPPEPGRYLVIPYTARRVQLLR